MINPTERNVTSFDLVREARSNLESLSKIDYPGRFFIAGRNSDGLPTVVYALTGRSEGSKNRKLVWENGKLRVMPADESKSSGDKSLTIYDAVIPVEGGLIVSNGSQGKEIATTLRIGDDFQKALSLFSYEPDEPIFTSRISALVSKEGLEMSNIKRGKKGETVRDYFGYLLPEEGIGRAMQTYDGTKGEKVKRFDREPYILDLLGTGEEIVERVWNALPKEHRIAVAVVILKPSGAQSTIKNQFGSPGVDYLMA